jgi:hypothetical protein
MRRSCFVLAFLAAFALAAAQPARAQMGMDIFKRPAITKVFHPIVGKGAVYLDTTKDGKARNSEISIVGKESVEGKEGFWMQFVSGGADGKMIVGKSLITPDDFQFHRMIFQQPGQPAMEMPMKMNAARKDRFEEKFEDWHSVGTESVTVPAGTFSCEHWRNDKTKSDVWTNEKISPFGLVKEVRPNSTMVLTQILDHASDRITGPVKQFDMQQMIQEMQEQRQQKQQP